MILFSQEGPGRESSSEQGRPEIWMPSGRRAGEEAFVTWKGVCLLLPEVEVIGLRGGRSVAITCASLLLFQTERQAWSLAGRECLCVPVASHL